LKANTLSDLKTLRFRVDIRKWTSFRSL